ncbi:hypothetical protein ASG29_07740 [Sphingomonas sp. Leaf412]|uniref:murein hydrolase activator EnvC family protein n=1 Tax=Sphingomonas sp. Leaf412 TaxID=1736370 RepID=UPI0006FCE1E7|nr:peptidoglycan DD-metalloendopeptidase family protein [Sphingomonas sp. Leaf412]KQT31793.1 hypothetical protein ASG29_07740 [Sphingomonas sp. Leaf412]
MTPRLRPLLAAVAAVAVAGAAWAAATPGDLRAANAAAAGAAREAARLDARAGASDDPAARARLERAAVAARVRGAEAEIAAARVRAALVEARLVSQRAGLAAEQGPVARLLAALTGLARRPAIAAVAQPGSIADLVHVQAVLSTTMPAVAARTAAIRDDLARARALQANATVAARSLQAGHARLVDARERLAALSGDDEQALALGERTRDIVDRLRTIGGAQATLADLAALPGPPVASTAPVGAAAYRLPVSGRLTTGLGEVSDNGVRARGLTFDVAAGVPVAVPAAGRVVFAGPFRSFGGTVIIDHGAGWTTAVTGLGPVEVARGARVVPGMRIGRAPQGEAPRVTVELRRNGRPVDITAMIG